MKSIIIGLILVFGLLIPSHLLGAYETGDIDGSDPVEALSLHSLLPRIGRLAYSMIIPYVEIEKPEWMSRVYQGYSFRTGDKPNYYIETVQPLYQDPEKNHTVFIQPRFNYDTEDDDFYNLGIGDRYYGEKIDALYGWNIFGDFERRSRHGRLGLGVEILGSHYDARFNSYIRLSPQRPVRGSTTEFERVVNGLDGEFGFRVPHFPWIKVFGGGHLFDFKHSGNLFGWRVRTELKPGDFGTFNVEWWNDSKDDVEWRADFRFNIGLEEFNMKNILATNELYRKNDVRERSLDRVEREHRLIKDKYADLSLEVGRT